MTESPNIIRSPLCQSFTADGVTAQIEIYRLEDGTSWTLELIDADGGSIVWEEQFATDAAAFAEFTEGLEEMGLANLIEPDEDDVATVH
ncbi:hypothetical protein DK26_19390 [Bosea sp. WAO]|uniref:hypothetical protein n=1 Tax=Bosea sp. WAO TaxID=406341 RepID=UPI0007481674|nr:hypothetical protein [Bosea sp. WAO]KUL93914.1 hypothetical protein DK26_19390 [Bosea sp. WAO]